MDHINQHATMNTNFSEKAFDAILNNIKLENDSLFEGESSDLEDSVCYSIDDKGTKQQDEIYELASTSYDKNVNDESNIQVTTSICCIGFRHIALVYLIPFVIHSYVIYIFLI